MPQPEPDQKRRRRRIIIGLIVALGGALGVGAIWWNRDPWPVRALIPYGDDHERLSWPGFSADSRSFLITRRSGVVEEYDAQTGRRRQPQPDPVIWAQVRSHDGRSLAGAVGNDPDNPDVVWADAASGAVRARIAVRTGRIWNLTFGPDDRSVRIITENTQPRLMAVATWDLASGAPPIWERLRPFSPGLQGLTPDGRSMICLDADAGEVWLDDELVARLPSRKAVLTTFPPVRSGVAPYQQIGCTPDGRALVIVARNGEATFWDMAGRRPIRKLMLAGPNEDCRGFDFTPDGKTLAVCRADIRRPPTRLERIVESIRRLLLGGSPPPRPLTVALVDAATGRVGGQFRCNWLIGVAPDGRSAATIEADGAIAIRTIPRPEGR